MCFAKLRGTCSEVLHIDTPGGLRANNYVVPCLCPVQNQYVAGLYSKLDTCTCVEAVCCYAVLSV